MPLDGGHDGPAAACVPLPATEASTRGTATRVPILKAVAALLLTTLALLFLTGNLPTPGPDQALALRERLLDLHARHPVASVAAYMAGYVLMTACSIPGAVFLTLTGGAVFGFGMALAAVSAASTAGACLAFLSARHLLRATVRRLWPGQLARIDAAMAHGGGSPDGPTQAGTQPPSPFPESSDQASAVHAAAGQASPARPPSGVPGSGLLSPGALCLLGLRCVPVMPYWLVNLLFGVTAMRLSTFATVSLLGMVPLNALYVHAGAELGRIRHLGDIISLRAGLALCLLAVAPLLLRRLMGTQAARRCAGDHRSPAQG
ncbi:TVP38/TMEM64 family protein [Desulfovibrio sp. DS-1]|nr:TVP38/TMEM64 family protein [Desulfovibrio sp. DS-1]